MEIISVRGIDLKPYDALVDYDLTVDYRGIVKMYPDDDKIQFFSRESYGVIAYEVGMETVYTVRRQQS